MKDVRGRYSLVLQKCAMINGGSETQSKFRLSRTFSHLQGGTCTYVYCMLDIDSFGPTGEKQKL
jgi:hypothetical protein